jgi:hypothetical protein
MSLAVITQRAAVMSDQPITAISENANDRRRL